MLLTITENVAFCHLFTVVVPNLSGSDLQNPAAETFDPRCLWLTTITVVKIKPWHKDNNR